MNAKYKTSRLSEHPNHNSPSKRAKVSSPGIRVSEQPSTSYRVPETEHSHEDLWKWTLTADAIAPCRIRDVFEMQECKGGKVGFDPDFFWLGRIPCRIVRIYGLVVGVQTYDARTVYSVDDGSGMIDCNLRHSTQLRFEHKSPRKSLRVSAVRPKSANSPAANEPPKPLARVGDIVRVVGRVLNRRQTRLVNVERMGLCRDANAEPQHWLKVSELHKSWYYTSDTSPFTIPPPKATQEHSPLRSSTQPQGGIPTQERPQSPSQYSVASSVPSSPSSVASTASSSSQYNSNSPPRLRHPCRLHSRDLTANTFRIYLKHYMDNVPPDFLTSSDIEDLNKVQDFDVQSLETPTKQRLPVLLRGEVTPRPNNRYPHTPRGEGIETPRPLPQRDNTDIRNGDSDENLLQGFTLSYLRRVPELALLARRVVEAETKRRAREQRKKQKEREATKGKAKMSAVSTSLGETSDEPRSTKIKSLFTLAIRQLYEEGSIILWDGPVRPPSLPPIAAPSFAPKARLASQLPLNSRLWKISSSHSTTGDSTVLSSVSQAEDEDEGDLSDPPPDEEAYLPLTPSYFADVVQAAIRDITIARRRAHTSRIKSTSTSGPSALEIARSLRQPVDGPTPSEIAQFLRKKDEKWRRIGEWAVKEALQWASDNGTVWSTGDGKWKLYG